MKKRNLLYAAISVICVIAIILGVYHQMFSGKVANESKVNIVEDLTDEEEKTDPKDTLAEFNKLFTNTFSNQGYSTENVIKYDGLENYDIIYTLYDGIKEAKEDLYDVDANIPVINIAAASELNGITQSLFADKTTKILQESNKYTIYSVQYVAYLNDNILSLAIKSTLKEGNSAQRIIVQTYNYDINTNKELTLNDVLEKYELKTRDVNKKIEEQVKEASEQASIISQATGQIVYKRDLNNAMYATDNAKNFLVGKDGQIYIIYAYGNNNITSEIDIIKI